MTDAERMAAAAPAIMSAFHAFRPGHDPDDRLSMRQIQALMIVGSGEEVTLTRLGAMLKIAPSTATELADRLAELGYLERLRDPGDHRSVRLSLSGKGLALLRRRREDLTGMFERMLDGMPSAERADFVRAFTRIGEIAGRIAESSRSPSP